MSALRYYRVTTPTVLQAWASYSEEVRALQAKGDAFAAMYPNAKAVFSYSVHGTSFYGLKFSPAMPPELWTLPDAKAGDTQRPRLSLSKKSSAAWRRSAAQQLKDLNAGWTENLPRDRPSLDSFWKSIGTDWGILMFVGIQYHLAPDSSAIYIATKRPLAPHCTEITGGEFEAGRSA